MQVPYALWLALILVGIFGSLGTLIGILITFFKERRSGILW